MNFNTWVALCNAFAIGMLLVLVGTQERNRGLNSFLLAANMAFLVWNVSQV